MARLTNCLVLELGAIPIVLVIAFMTLVSATVLFGGVALGGFCAHAEHNTVNIVSSLREGTRHNNITTLTQFYLTGHPNNNSIVETLRSVENSVGPISENMWILGPALDLLGLWCHRMGSAMLPSLLKEVVPDLELILPLAKRDHIYGHYNQIVNLGLCGQLVGSVGWYLVCQMFVGLVLLPMIAIHAHRYLTEVVEEARLVRAKASDESKALLSTKVVPIVEKNERINNVFTCCGRQSRPVV